jgi:hypothetical protein
VRRSDKGMPSKLYHGSDPNVPSPIHEQESRSARGHDKAPARD